MNQIQSVPNYWNLEAVTPTVSPTIPPNKSLISRSQSTSLSTGLDTSTVDYEMAELTWQNGQLTMHGLGLPRTPEKTNQGGAGDEKQVTRAGGTLESVVNPAAIEFSPSLSPIGTCDHDDNLVPWLHPRAKNYSSAQASLPMVMDALVPSDSNGNRGLSKCMVASSTRVGSCGAAAVGSDWSLSVSASESDRWQSTRGGGVEKNSEQLRSIPTNGKTSTSFGASMENTKTITLDNDHDSACQSRPHRERDAQEERNQRRNTTKSTRRNRAAAIHNQSERKRRDKINQRMKTLQKMVPNSNKTDKASMLEEIIDYLKQLQAQLQMFNTMYLPSMMMPLAIQQQLQMSMMPPMGMGLGMGMNMDPMNMSLNSAMARPNIAALPPAVMNPAAYMPFLGCDNAFVAGDRMSAQANLVSADPLSAYLACQSNPNTMEAYSRIAAMYQQLQQQKQQQQPGPSPNT